MITTANVLPDLLEVFFYVGTIGLVLGAYGLATDQMVRRAERRRVLLAFIVAALMAVATANLYAEVIYGPCDGLDPDSWLWWANYCWWY